MINTSNLSVEPDQAHWRTYLRWAKAQERTPVSPLPPYESSLSQDPYFQ